MLRRHQETESDVGEEEASLLHLQALSSQAFPSNSQGILESRYHQGGSCYFMALVRDQGPKLWQNSVVKAPDGGAEEKGKMLSVV